MLSLYTSNQTLTTNIQEGNQHQHTAETKTATENKGTNITYSYYV